MSENRETEIEVVADGLDALLVKFADNPRRQAEVICYLMALMHSRGPAKVHPVGCVRWVPIEKVEANDYNPNSVAGNEMKLLHTSISHDGYTQPVVTVYDPLRDIYVIVDGFHRYSTMRNNPDISATTKSRFCGAFR